MAYITLDHVSFEYPGGFLAVDDISMEIEKGECIAIIGQNGAGKTTTVKMLNGLLRPTKGDVIIGDMNSKDHTIAQMSRNVGYVFQNPDDQIFHSTIYDEVAFGTKVLNKTEQETKELVDYALEITNLAQYRDVNPFNLPFSIRKFISIAAIIAMDTQVMIFDEPTAGQDLTGNLRLSSILEHLHKEGKTLITISHDMEFVVNNFDRVIVMANKKVVTSGAPSEIFWNFEALEKSMLKQPYVSRLCKTLNLGGNIVTMEETSQAILKAVNAKTVS
ncbi:ABC transporter ATP-binding protein [Clostridium sp. KNHs216]|uniref:energy-coupling factor ABC transporter ATP-binding protein n=1 Tax=Clostridium sp. KNHs216 TaxID=1550235 RepID=UPI001153B225|nr:ABC transporter ATP-binding protein [Clostridium sp. KNHs216]TQI67012.1 energy-coupling factor transport system ATP-binding protein [Clostridium sp. KNHs216]